jgi:hypothetical protein
MTEIKRAVDMAQAVECHPSKCKALSSNPSTTKKGKKREFLFEILLQLLYL